MAFQRKKRTDKQYTPDEVLGKMEYFCAWQERSPHEVREKMRDFNLNQANSEQIYSALEENGFFNEVRFAESFVRGKFRVNHWGRIRIRMELKMRRIAPEILEAALNTLEETAYIEMIERLIVQKKAQYGSEDPRARDKTAAALLRAGFEPDLVFKYL
jgi:regulatory protein